MQRFTPSLLDRLFDDSVDTSADHLQRGLTLEQMKASVARDIESLLNTRIGPMPEAFSGLPLTRDSILSFGLDDFVGLSLSNPNDRATICQSIREAILRHEPRLQGVEVTITPHAGLRQFLNFTVTAMLVLDPTMEAVSFDALLQPVTQQYAVSHSRGSSLSQSSSPAGNTSVHG
ncbi:type VI secretion system baseplate subunit TssE [Piscinibacter sp. HJYY11]|uniref:type VI secretion system baseplate subunit TssE n=1 Tax=Piscinibacter sp. HJYY11 TaxID=2801333 RepID=UPI00191E93E9|nr:type VI secretion system baseplate subunit TssE [Piscinibacter sp. HJYY11]MBL0730551.1 type VI secretion system baseplate subunit TssE [Piscinibacter sp. HJYY11]